MSLSRRSFAFSAKILAAAVLTVAGAQPALPQARGKAPLALQGHEVTLTSPQFKVEALWFKANDETGWYWTGSDEVYAVFSDMDPRHYDHQTSTYGNVDEGDTVNFSAADRCMATRPDCSSGTADLNVRFSFWERDPRFEIGVAYCPGDIDGSHTRLMEGECSSHDLIGRGSIIHSRNDLVAMLPAVGDSRESTAVMDQDAGVYRFRYRITRLPDAQVSIVIHLPPGFDPTNPVPTITLQATVDENDVRLTWSGTTTNTVDIRRDGTVITQTPNDGSHTDTAPAGTHRYRVCNLGSTTACSPEVTVTVQ